MAAAAATARKKYDIWSANMREEALAETMRNFGVNRDSADNGRSVEWYDYTMANRFSKDGKTNRLKRKRMGADFDHDDEDSNEMDTDLMEASGCGGAGGKQYGGKRVCFSERGARQSRTPSPQDYPRMLDDLIESADIPLSDEDLAKDLAAKLRETNEALICKYIKYRCQIDGQLVIAFSIPII